MEALHDRVAQTEEEQGEQTKRQNLRDDWPSFGTAYEKTFHHGRLFIAGEQLGFRHLVGRAVGRIIEGELVLQAPGENGNRQTQEYKAEPG